MPRRLVWTHESLEELELLLRRRNRKTDVQNCVASHASLVAEELSIASEITGPSHFKAYVFDCPDEGARIYIRLIFDAESEVELVVLSCRTVEF